MGCSTCTNGNDNKSAGCKNNGTCGTGGCNKLNVFDWFTEMDLPSGQALCDIVEVRFKGTRKFFYRNVNKFNLKVNDPVIVEASSGHDIGYVSIIGELVRFQMKKKRIKEDSSDIKKIYRLPSSTDMDKYNKAKELERTTLNRSREIILQLNLDMKLSDVEYQGDKTKAIFYYTADNRIDFRELIKKLVDEFKIRVEMKQIGMRQEAGRLGGIGVCGRELCCSTWLTDFKSVSTSAARYQNLSINTMKLAGQCGKLKCCLNYELDSYMDALIGFPKNEEAQYLQTEDGTAMHQKTDIFKRTMWYSYQGKNDWYPLNVKQVLEIIEMNKKGRKPANLSGYAEKPINKSPENKNFVHN